MTPESGLFIAFEGIDGCGKGTQAKILAKHLFDLNKRHHVFLTREPGRSDYEREIRRILKTETDPYKKGIKLADLFIEDRRRHVKESVGPILAYGGIVISDRFKHSTLAYQHTQGIPLDELINRHHGIPAPHLTFIFDLPAEEAAIRLSQDETREYQESFEQVEFQEKLRQNYLKLPSVLETEAITIIDAERSIEEIAQEIITHVTPLLYKVA